MKYLHLLEKKIKQTNQIQKENAAERVRRTSEKYLDMIMIHIC